MVSRGDFQRRARRRRGQRRLARVQGGGDDVCVEDGKGQVPGDERGLDRGRGGGGAAGWDSKGKCVSLGRRAGRICVGEGVDGDRPEARQCRTSAVIQDPTRPDQQRNLRPFMFQVSFKQAIADKAHASSR